MKRFARNYFEDFVNRKKSEVALMNFSPDFLDHDEPTGVLQRSPVALKTGLHSRQNALTKHSFERAASRGEKF
jgi:hypothetical protein